MDRPEQPDRAEPPSIFTKPDPLDEPMPAVAAPLPKATLEPLDVSTWASPAHDERKAYAPRPDGPRPPTSDGSGPSRRTIVSLAAMGGAAILLMSFIAFSLLGNDDTPVVAAGDASPTPSASRSAEPTVETTAEPSATPEPTAEPTPAGRPVELAVGDWATVTEDELHVFSDVGGDQESTYSLVRGAVLTVAEGPQVVDGGNWYRVASLGGATGWVSSGWTRDPYLETILNDPVLIRCGEVANPVFDMVNGTPHAREVLRVGDFAVPANKLDEITLASIELARGIRAEVCITAQVGSDGLPFLRSEPGVSACGHAVPDGQAFWLRPHADQVVEISIQIKDSALVHPVLLSGQADHRMSSNLRTLLTMMSHEGAAGCVESRFKMGGGGGADYRAVQLRQCSIVSESNDSSIQLRPAAGGPTAWIKFPVDGYRPDVPLDTPSRVFISASASPDGFYADAWLDSWEQGDCP